jgi:S1-C subfamily serine protease
MALQTLDNREQELRDQLGDAAYDAYLYAAGRPNRLVVTSVLESAPAGQAGIVTGDRIVGYDNRRIYNWRDLRNAMSGGSITDTVEIEVERDGHSLQFYLNRGPLGVRTDSQSLAP